jgi:phosphohistidine phosphatase
VEQRRLVLVRHAQAGDAPSDRERPLTEHGQRQAAAVGERLARLGIAPDRVVVSPALRARQTCEQVRSALEGAPEADVDRRIYENTLDGLFDVLRETGDDVRTLLLVGHNPAVGQVAYDLDDGEGDPVAREDLGRGFPAGSAAVFDVDSPFAVLGPGAATLVHVLLPAD